jgi:hypothetical protein
MRVQDIIRSIIDFIDSAEAEQEPKHDLSPLSITGQDNDELQRMKQIAGLMPSDCDTEYANEPQEQYAGIEAVTVDAGGGVNGPKDPSDIRGDHVSLYPAHQHGFRE